MTEVPESNDSLSELTAEDQHQEDEVQSRKWKRHEFCDYLSETGVSVVLTNAILELYRADERPSDPIEFVRAQMRPNNEDVIQIEIYRRDIEKLQSKANCLREERDRLLERKRKLQALHIGEFVCEDHIITDDEEIL